MHAALFLSAALAALASAKPLDKRDVVIEYVTEVTTVTQVVRVNAPAAPTVTPRRHRHKHVTVVTTVNVPAVRSSPTPEESPQPAPTTSSTSQPPPPPPTSTKSEPPPPPPPTSTTTEAPPADPTPPAQSRTTESGGDYKKTALDSHNSSRAKHGVPALVWDEELFSIAKQIAGSCKYAHDTKTGGGGYGQNIAAGAKASEIHKVIIDQFYSEVKYYKWYGREPDMGNFAAWGHFSAMVWKDTTSVACWTEDCSGRAGKLAGVASNVPPHFTVCNYRKPGNVGGQYAKNVLAPKY